MTSLPSQIKSLFQSEGHTQAVAVAPGVWAALTPGADPVTAAIGGPLDGYCASKRSYEVQYLNGQQTSGSCF